MLENLLILRLCMLLLTTDLELVVFGMVRSLLK